MVRSAIRKPERKNGPRRRSSPSSLAPPPPLPSSPVVGLGARRGPGAVGDRVVALHQTRWIRQATILRRPGARARGRMARGRVGGASVFCLAHMRTPARLPVHRGRWRRMRAQMRQGGTASRGSSHRPVDGAARPCAGRGEGGADDDDRVRARLAPHSGALGCAFSRRHADRTGPSVPVALTRAVSRDVRGKSDGSLSIKKCW